MTHCSRQLHFNSIKKHKVIADFSGGNITGNAGLLLLREADSRAGVIDGFASLMEDRRDQNKIHHSLEDLLRQRVFQICCGYEDANDSNELRKDYALKTACGRAPESEEDLGSQPTISRMENQVSNDDVQRLLRGFVDFWLNHRERPVDNCIILDVDATDDETYGQQEFAAFHGYYDHYCYLPLLFHDGETGDLILPFLRPGNSSAMRGADGILLYLAERAREKWPGVQILVRGDSGFCGEDFYRQMEDSGIDYILGIARNTRLEKLAEPLMTPVRFLSLLSDQKMTAFAWGEYAASSWSKKRSIVVKAERLKGKDNPRFLITTLDGNPEDLYRKLYCLRADRSENRIKDLMTGCYADRLSCHGYTANFFRLIQHSIAYLLMHRLRKACKTTPLEKAEIQTLRLKLLKVGARVIESCRRIRFQLSSVYPYKNILEAVHAKLVLA